MEKKYNISLIVLWLLIAVSVVVLVMFLGFGYGTQETINNNVYTAPRYTGLLLIWLYALVAICSGVAVLFAIINGIAMLQSRAKGHKSSGWTFTVLFFTALVIVVTYFFASDIPVRIGDASLFENVMLLKLTDICLLTIYMMSAATILCTLFSMIGIFRFKRKRIKK